MEYHNGLDRLNTLQIQMLYSAAGDYWEVLDEICAEYNVEKLWELEANNFNEIIKRVRQLAATAPKKYKDI